MTTDTTAARAGAAAKTLADGAAFSRIAGISGIVFAIAIIASQFLVGDMPGAGDDVSALREYFEDNRGPHQVGLVVVGLAIVPFILFTIGLVRAQRRNDPADGAWSSAVGAFFVFGAVVYTIGLVIDAGLLLSYDSGLGDDVLRSLWDVSFASTPIMVLGFGAATTSVSIIVLTRRTWPAWYGGLGLLAGIGAIAGLGTLVSDSDGAAALGFATFPVFMLWLLASGVFLYRDA